MSPTGYEVGFYRDVQRIRDALELLADERRDRPLVALERQADALERIAAVLEATVAKGLVAAAEELVRSGEIDAPQVLDFMRRAKEGE